MDSPIWASPALACPEIMLVISPTASLASCMMSPTSSPSMFFTMATAHFLVKDSEMLPRLSPVSPTMAETSPAAELFFFT